MITKATQHDIDRSGRVLFTRVFQGLAFTVNPTAEDYGIDYNVQVFDEDSHPTGAWFHVQLKSAKRLRYSADKKHFTFSLKRAHLEHYADELKEAVVVIFVDVGQERVFFFTPQLATLDLPKEDTSETRTIRVPLTDELPLNAPTLMEDLRRCYIALATREITKASLLDFQRVVSFAPDKASFHTAMQDKNDLLRLQRALDAFHDGRPDEALQRAHAITSDPDSKAEIQFQALSLTDAAKWKRALRMGKYGRELAEPHFEFSRGLRQLSSSLGSAARLASLMIRTSAELDVLVFEDGADYMASKQHSHAGNMLRMVTLQAKRGVSARRILRKYEHFVRLARLATTVKDAWLPISLMSRIATSLAPYQISLRSNLDIDTQTSLTRSCLGVLQFAYEAARQIGDVRSMALALSGANLLLEDERTQVDVWLETNMTTMPQGDDKAWIEESIRRGVLRRRGIPQSGDYNPDPQWQIAEKLALSAGLNIADESSLLVRRLRIGARDSQPDRHMRFCEHLVVGLGRLSPVVDFLHSTTGLGTCGNKVIHCNLFDLHAEGTEQDTAFAVFKRNHCDACDSRKPRADDWEYTDITRAAFEAANLPFMRAATLRGFGIRRVGVDDLEVASPPSS